MSAIAKENHSEHQTSIADNVIATQRENLAISTKGRGFGPQSPRDLNSLVGTNPINFSPAPAYTEMNLCNIHFHKNAEHSGGEFTTYAGNGNGQGVTSGYQYSGKLTKAELMTVDHAVCSSEHGALISGDTIEVHYVYSSAQVSPGPTLGACLNEAINNPQLRVETQVFVLVNDAKALDFSTLTALDIKNGLHQALNMLSNSGEAIQYLGSTTGPSYNQVGSLFQVSWSVHPKVAKVNIDTVGNWCEGNVFKEDHAHGVRNLVTNPALLSPMK
ncbi:delta-class carbonic anhydrase [Shewanella vesiculosa]|uniref:Delta-class carbonic anhydrase n=2 Tax=Shewanella vesiculosa TaxID=518738 RepID=A0ABV0FM94_9GAMM